MTDTQSIQIEKTDKENDYVKVIVNDTNQTSDEIFVFTVNNDVVGKIREFLQRTAENNIAQSKHKKSFARMI